MTEKVRASVIGDAYGPHRAQAMWVWVRALLVLMPGLWLLGPFMAHPNHDVALVIQAAERMLDGQRLYIDIVDVNPPLVFWVTSLGPLLERAVGVLTAVDWYLLLVCLVILGAPLAVRGLLAGTAGGITASIATLWALSALPGDDFGQREHLMLCAALPYLALAVRRREGLSARPLSLCVAGLAGLMFAFKPDFLLIPAIVELWLLWRRGWRATLIDAHCWALAVPPALYAVSVLVLTPSYFEVALPLALDLYQPMQRGFRAVLFGSRLGPILPVVGLLSLAAIFWSRDTLVRLSAATAVAAVLIGARQGMGWSYHLLPAMSLALWCTVLLCGEFVRRAPAGTLSSLWRGMAAATTMAVAIIWVPGVDHVPLPQQQQPGQVDPTDRMTTLFETYAQNDSVLVLAMDVWPFYPAINEAETRMAMRFFTMWPLAGAYRVCSGWDDKAPVPFRPPERMGDSERFVFNGVAEDFARNRPALLIVQTDWFPRTCTSRLFDFLAYFRRHPTFARTLEGYAPLTAFDNLVVLRRRGAAGQIPPTVPTVRAR